MTHLHIIEVALGLHVHGKHGQGSCATASAQEALPTMSVVLNRHANHLPRDTLDPIFHGFQQFRCGSLKDKAWYSTNHSVAVVHLVFREFARKAQDINEPQKLRHTPQYAVLPSQIHLFGVPRLVVLGVGRRSRQEVALALGGREPLHWLVVASVKQTNTAVMVL